MKHIQFASALLLSALLAGCGTMTQPGRTYVVTGADGTRQTVTVSAQESKSQAEKVAKKQADKAPQASQTQPDKAEATAADLAAERKTIHGEWTIYSVRNNLVTGEERPYFTIDLTANRFYGSNGCNILNGDVVLGQHRDISFDHVVATLKRCADAQYEYLINLAINDVRSYKIRHEGSATFLDLRNDLGRTILVLRRHNMEFLNGAWRVSELEGKALANSKLTLVVDIPELRIHGNGGCNTFNGNLFIDPDKNRSMQFQNIRATRATCPDIETESRYLLALESVESAEMQTDGSVVMFDASKYPVIKLIPLKLKD